MSHVTWPKLLPLALRLQVARSLARSTLPLDVCLGDSYAKAVLDEFDRLALAHVGEVGRDRRSDEEADSEGPAIDAYYARVLRAISVQAEPASKKSSQAAVILESIKGACANPVCRKCVGAETGWCRWTRSSGAADAAQMAKHALCLQPVVELFNWSVAVATQAYSSACNQAVDRCPVLSTGHDCRCADLELSINGFTGEGDGGTDSGRPVRIVFDVEHIGVQDYLSLPYVLMHECVAHGFCGVDIGDEDAELSKPFHDGWMDGVAFQVLSAELAEAEKPLDEIGDDVRSQTECVRKVRYNAYRDKRCADVRKWILGSRALDTMQRLFAMAANERYDDWGEASHIARHALMRLSLQMNASTLSHEVRQRFVQSISVNYDRTGTDQQAFALASKPEIIDLIGDYLDAIMPPLDLVTRVASL